MKIGRGLILLFLSQERFRTGGSGGRGETSTLGGGRSPSALRKTAVSARFDFGSGTKIQDLVERMHALEYENDELRKERGKPRAVQNDAAKDDKGAAGGRGGSSAAAKLASQLYDVELRERQQIFDRRILRLHEEIGKTVKERDEVREELREEKQKTEQLLVEKRRTDEKVALKAGELARAHSEIGRKEDEAAKVVFHRHFPVLFTPCFSLFTFACTTQHCAQVPPLTGQLGATTFFSPLSHVFLFAPPSSTFAPQDTVRSNKILFSHVLFNYQSQVAATLSDTAQEAMRVGDLTKVIQELERENVRLRDWRSADSEKLGVLLSGVRTRLANDGVSFLQMLKALDLERSGKLEKAEIEEALARYGVTTSHHVTTSHLEAG